MVSYLISQNGHPVVVYRTFGSALRMARKMTRREGQVVLPARPRKGRAVRIFGDSPGANTPMQVDVLPIELRPT